MALVEGLRAADLVAAERLLVALTARLERRLGEAPHAPGDGRGQTATAAGPDAGGRRVRRRA
jgi:hypothetical protein